ncbi:hypothetical protein [Algicola sagamiensis]|uniref:hypothetical protein n=1 Tax=Algicola sagamiensis TaxID=163869 RepID=UPI00058E1A60|nr:hypothetical protein [Algicola sagamiensis]
MYSLVLPFSLLVAVVLYYAFDKLDTPQVLSNPVGMTAPKLFGQAMAVSGDGNTLMIADSPSVVVYSRTLTNEWQQTARLPVDKRGAISTHRLNEKGNFLLASSLLLKAGFVHTVRISGRWQPLVWQLNIRKLDKIELFHYFWLLIKGLWEKY